MKFRTFSVFLFLCCTVGTFLRLWLVIASNWKIDYDEAMIGLMTRHLLQGQWSAFIVGQPTLGSIETYLLAPLFTIFGANVYTFRFYSLFINIIYVISSAYLGKSFLGEKGGMIAGLLASVAPPYMLVTGIKTWGATIETVVVGNFLFFALHRMITGEIRRQSWSIVTGIAAGALFWNSWLSTYYLIPAGIVWLWKYRITRPYTFITIATFFVGSSPFWLHNLTHNFDTFTTLLSLPVTEVNRLSILEKMLFEQYPTLLTGFYLWLTELAPIQWRKRQETGTLN